MTTSNVLSLIDQLLAEPVLSSWHEKMRDELGIPEECAKEAVMSLVFYRAGSDIPTQTIAFVLEEKQVRNTLMALSEFMREAFHPAGSKSSLVAVLDFLPALDESGAAHGISRRWVLDQSNYTLVMQSVSSIIKTLAIGL